MEIVKPMEKPEPPVLLNLKNIEETNIPRVSIYKIPYCNNKALEIEAPEGSILISYESKVQLINWNEINDQYQKIRYVSKTYNKFSVTTSKHQSEHENINNFNRYEGVNIYLPNRIAQKFFNAAITDPGAFQRMERQILNNYVVESETLENIQYLRDYLPACTPEQQLQEWNKLKEKYSQNKYFQEITLEKTEEEQLKTVRRQRSTWTINNIVFELLVTWTNKGKLKGVKLQKIRTNYKSILEE